MDVNISNEILALKARLFEINEVKKSEEPLRDRLNQLIGSAQTLEEIKKQTQEEAKKKEELLKKQMKEAPTQIQEVKIP